MYLSLVGGAPAVSNVFERRRGAPDASRPCERVSEEEPLRIRVALVKVSSEVLDPIRCEYPCAAGGIMQEGDPANLVVRFSTFGGFVLNLTILRCAALARHTVGFFHRVALAC